ncbi:class I SAM-dependent methyltransferase [Rhodoblastus acidophilus]|uniref:Class I SAM-dependent methyltransferase n=1 Tax=Candidatus Rhodoblastus alkanivorans TaxID=2954117 RepID=A0ABS9Z858_9HYPH|nr:class I SAM-dependent methyltransferase [Candidatus Rhodoblastus alkanivorans]MCI4678372.1 class I SAM-dependent methyltransferase [Candidatus Rhodoblastus alkanivorans]MCI4683630.1 class I SAM-dependent methyltransferase [Candidatus Rhodoblastus alkanivorans]MDI4640946.1 class I SAM-dependent methyltransferase [Rhodoblastus acidophilus]
MNEDRKSHWQGVYTAKAETEVSWFQATPSPSLELLRLAGADRQSAIIDIGGGASLLVDHLLAEGFSDLTVLDLSEAALAKARARLGEAAGRVHWIVGDAAEWAPPKAYDFWHDRAAFHFLTEPAEREAYMERLRRALRVGGAAIIGTFAPDGPQKCSGLSVVRHDSKSLAEALGPGFELLDERRHEHHTPWGSIQKFQFSAFRRTG